jgi:hypothetical protein
MAGLLVDRGAEGLRQISLRRCFRPGFRQWPLSGAQRLNECSRRTSATQRFSSPPFGGRWSIQFRRTMEQEDASSILGRPHHRRVPGDPSNP